MKREPKLEFFQDKKNEWQWRTVAVNGRILGGSTEGYKRRRDAERGAGLTAQAILASKQAPSSNAIN